jgi:hypothetical protein
LNVAATNETDTTVKTGRLRRFYIVFVIVALAGLGLLDVAALVIFYRDSSELKAIASRVTEGAATPSEEMRKLVDYVAREVPHGRPDKFILASVFRPLRPTALQVIQHGGDCSYKARAFIVLARKRGIPAHKVALHDRKGEPVHAVAVVETERGPYVADLLYGILFERPDGSPIPLEELQNDPAVLPEVVGRCIDQGLIKPGKYPLEKYVYSDVKSYNWKQNPLAAACYRGLAPLVGERWLDQLPRPYVESEPALMIVSASGVAALGLVTPLLFLRIRDRRRANRMKSAVAAAGAGGR